MDKREIQNQPMISISQFLRDYYEVDNEDIINRLSVLSHKELKTICKEGYGIDINSMPFEDVTIESLKCGSALLVRDGHGNPAPYHNPQFMYFNEILQNNKTHK